MMKLRFGWLATAVISAGIAGIAGWFYAGFYPIGADVPHNRLTFSLLELVRERSIARASSEVTIPKDMDTPERILAGGADYNEMCSQCHLKPDRTESDFSVGLNPAPPNLSTKQDGNGIQIRDELKRRFWVIKHGIKASGMPAWKYHHEDERIWNIVAFIERLPELSPAQYQILTTRNTTPSTTESDHH